MLVWPQNSCHRSGEADAGWRHVGIERRRGARAVVTGVSAWIPASAVLADEGAVLVELDVNTVSVVGQTVVTAAFALADGRLTDGALLNITAGETEQRLRLQSSGK